MIQQKIQETTMQEEETKNLTSAEEEGRDRRKNPLVSLRTFKTDSASYVKEKNISLIDVAAAQSRKGVSVSDSDTPQKKLLYSKKIFLVLAIFLLLAGGGFGAYTFWGKKMKPPPIVYHLSKPVLVAEKEKEAVGFGEIKNLLSEPLNRGEMLSVSVVKKSEQEVRSMTWEEFFSVFGIVYPSNFPHIFKDHFSFYVYKFQKNWPILILKTESYEQAFAEMLKWESSFPLEIKKIFSMDYSALVAPAFTDKEIQNHDARILYDSEGETVVVYSFVNRKYLVITNGQEALEEIYRRFSLPEYLNY